MVKEGICGFCRFYISENNCIKCNKEMCIRCMYKWEDEYGKEWIYGDYNLCIQCELFDINLEQSSPK